MMKQQSVVVIVSGGMDSVTLLHDIVQQGYIVHALSFDYGQKHRKELKCAAEVCETLMVPHKIINLSILNDLAPSALTRSNRPVPDGKYDEPSMKDTVVPNRNMVMISLAVSYAIGIKANTVFYGAHAGDHTIYPDCRESFVESLAKAVAQCDWQPVTLRAPYLRMDKGDIAIRGKELGVDFSKTWSCYKGGEVPCGTCGACTERAEAFKKAGIEGIL